MNDLTSIRLDIGNLEQIIDALEKKLYHKAINICNLKANVYYKHRTVIADQLKHNIQIDMVNNTKYGLEYAKHLISDLEWEEKLCQQN